MRGQRAYILQTEKNPEALLSGWGGDIRVKFQSDVHLLIDGEVWPEIGEKDSLRDDITVDLTANTSAWAPLKRDCALVQNTKDQRYTTNLGSHPYYNGTELRKERTRESESPRVCDHLPTVTKITCKYSSSMFYFLQNLALHTGHKFSIYIFYSS